MTVAVGRNSDTPPKRSQWNIPVADGAAIAVREARADFPAVPQKSDSPRRTA